MTKSTDGRLDILPGSLVDELLAASRLEILDVVAKAYMMHESGQSVNPDSYFLRFPEKPASRLIALPSYLGGAVGLIGLKWVSSFPSNVQSGRPRAAATLMLNDYETGYPIALLEGAGISAARTAASAALAAKHLGVASEGTIAFVGAGVIARTIVDYIAAVGLSFSSAVVSDLDAESASHLADHIWKRLEVEAAAASTQAACEADLVVLATNAAQPHVDPAYIPRSGQLVLNISLRDLPPEVILRSNNVLDDVEHCLKADTSPHLAEQRVGHRDFIHGTLGSYLSTPFPLDPTRGTIFSPFGLGILDVAVGEYIFRRGANDERVISIPNFINATTRW